jgi:acetylornithine deacetylase/succinyl-diaminopimelate desuccinylase-like protein
VGVHAFSLIRACQDILKIPSCSSYDKHSHLGNQKVVQALAEITSDLLQCKIFAAPGRPRDKTLVLWPKGFVFPDRGGLALHTHLDTVPPGDLSKWVLAAPFSGARKSGYLVGVGAADVKCDALCKIAALFTTQPQKNSDIPYFVGSFSEEVGMHGIRFIAKRAIVRPRWALVGEPSEGHLSYANKGFASLHGSIAFRWVPYNGKPSRQSFAGKSAHSSAPQKGKNAIANFLDALARNPKLPITRLHGSVAINVIPGEFSVEAQSKMISQDALLKLVEVWKAYKKWAKEITTLQSSSLFAPATATSQWTILEIVDDHIRFSMDLRCIPGQSAEKLAKKLQIKSVPIHLDDESLAFYQNPKGNFGRWIKPCLAPQKKFITKSGANEAAYYQHLGAEAFVHAPGISYGNIHSPNEKIKERDLYEAAGFYSRVVTKACSS